MPSVFISYSRRDSDFVERLHDALVERSYDVWIDRDDIPASAEWFEEIRAGIAGADGVVYVISPASASSEVCTRELELAVEQHKRIVPAVYREPDGRSVPEAAAALNWVFLRDSDDFGAGIEVLVQALETDLDHVRTHTRLGVASGRWDAAGRDHSQLLRGAELTAAEAWLVGAGDKQPQPTQVEREYVLASRQAATRRQRTVIGGVSVALVIALVLGVIALVQRSTAIHERNVATARFLDAAAQSNATFDPELGVLLAIQGARIDPGSSTEEALRQAMAVSHVRTTYAFPGATSAPDAVWSPDGTRLLVASPGVSARIYRPGTNEPAVTLPPPSSNGQAVWDSKGDRILIGGRHPAAYDAATGHLIARIPGIAIHVALSSDGTRAATTDVSSAGHVFDVATGRLLATFHPVYVGGVTCLAWAPDDSVVAQCDTQSTAVSTAPAALDLWDPRTGKLLHSDHSDEIIGRVAFSADSRRYVYVTTNAARGTSLAALERAAGKPGTFVRDTRTGAELGSFVGSASAATLSSDGGELAYATVGDDFGHVYNFASGLNHTLSGATAVISSIRFNPAGTYTVTGSDDGMARVYNASTGALLETLADGDTGSVEDASFGLGDTAIATTSSNGQAHLWTSPDPRPAHQIELPGLAPAATVGFTTRGDRIVVAGGRPQAGIGAILNADGLRVAGRFGAQPGYTFAGATTSRDGGLIAALAYRRSGGKLRGEVAETFDGLTGRAIAKIAPSIPGATPITVTMDLAGDQLVTGEANGDTEAWNPRTGTRLRLLPATGPVAVIAYSPDGSVLAVAHLPAVPARLTSTNETQLGDVRIDLWQARTGKLLRRIDGPQLTPLVLGVKQFAPLAITFNPNGRLVTLAGADTKLWTWATRTGAPVVPLQVPSRQFATSLAFSPNDRMLVAGTASGAYVWNLSSPSSPLPAFQHADPSQFSIENGGGVFVGFTRDSRILATAGDTALEAWSISDHLQLFDAYAPVGTLSFDGTEFAAAGGDQVSVYPCDLCGRLPQLLAVAKREVTRGLTAQERSKYLGTA